MIARSVALVAHVVLIASLVVLVRLSAGLLIVLPLLAPVRGLWRGDRYTYAWSSMLLIFYCAGFLAEAYMRPTLAVPLRALAIIAALEFVSVILFVRLQARAARAGAEARPPVARTER